jgi:hypothetical protein
MIAAGGAGDAGDILRGSSGKTNAVVFSAVQPHRLGVLKAALNALVAEERILTAPWSLPRWYRPSKRLLRASASGDRASGSRPGVVTPATLPPNPSVLRECRVWARAHLYAGARYIVVRGLGLGCSKRPIPSEYRSPMHGSAYGLLRKSLPRTRVNKGLCTKNPLQYNVTSE